jgi:hypothetical protein
MEFPLLLSSSPQKHVFEEWARSLEECNAGTLPETGQPLVSSTEWARLEDVAVRRSLGLSVSVFPSVFARLI